MGKCQQGGSSIDWVMKAEGVSFRHAVELLRADLPVGAARAVKHSRVRRLAPPLAPDADDRAVLVQVVDYYHEQLKQSPEALATSRSAGCAAPRWWSGSSSGSRTGRSGIGCPRRAGRRARSCAAG
jgi:hypothetical protein